MRCQRGFRDITPQPTEPGAVHRVRRYDRKPEHFQAFADLGCAVAGSRVESLPGVGHSPMIEDPPRTAALLLTFTTSVLNGQ
jgi:hypothetical protein